MKSIGLRPGKVFLYCLSDYLSYPNLVYVLNVFVSLLYCNIIQYLLIHKRYCYRVQNMLRDKEIEVCERVSMTMDDLYNENQRYT